MKKILLITFFIFSSQTIIQEAVYNLMYNNLYFSYENKNITVTNNTREEINSNFRIKKVSENSDTQFYYLEHINTNLNLLLSPKNTLHIILNFTNITKNSELLSEWNFIESTDNKYKIQNKNKCFIKVTNNTNVTCEIISSEYASPFKLIKIYDEVTEDETNRELIEIEPIDVVIKYIDLTDTNISIRGMPKNRPEFDIEEIRYCVRSIIQNIPWVRKIFILMPHKKVKYFKDYDLIQDRIIYVKDKDFFGTDNFHTLPFKFRYWKLKKYGLSENFIAMDHNYYIRKPLKKSDFFYVVDGKVVPAIITSRFIELKNKTNGNLREDLKINIYKICTRDVLLVKKNSLYQTYLFISKLFNEADFVPAHTFNAIPVNTQELDEICTLIYNSEFRFNTLYSMFPQEKSIQFQAFVLSYTFLKYKRKVKSIPTRAIRNRNPVFNNYNYSLFSMTTEGKDIMLLKKTKIVLEYLFQEPSPYEIIDDTLHILAYNTVYTLDAQYRSFKEEKKNITNQLKERIKEIKLQIEYYYMCIAITVIIICMWGKINHHLKIKENDKLKGYQPFNKRETY